MSWVCERVEIKDENRHDRDMERWGKEQDHENQVKNKKGIYGG